MIVDCCTHSVCSTNILLSCDRCIDLSSEPMPVAFFSSSSYLRRLLVANLFGSLLLFLWLFSPGERKGLYSRYNEYTCPGYLTSPISHNVSASTPAQNSNATGTSSPPDFPVSPFAYVFYATQSDYACSVLVNIDRLVRLFNTSHRIIVLVKPDLGSEYLTAFTAQNATVIPYEPPQLTAYDGNYYQDVLLKLVAFRLHHYIPSLKRVLILDADQIILKSLDHVFDLPAVDLAAPRAYWIGNGFTSAFLLISPSDRLWNKVADGMASIGAGVFDMDLVNKLFENTLMLLPGDYATLNSHWEANDLPNWWQGDVPQQTYFPVYRPPPRYPSGNNTNQTDEVVILELERAQEMERLNAEERKNRFSTALSEVYDAVKVLHFTAVAKPWSIPPDSIPATQPMAHDLLATQFGIWHTAAEALCPAWKENHPAFMVSQDDMNL